MRQFTQDPLRRLLSATERESSNIYAQLRPAVGFCGSENLTAVNPALFGGTSWDLNIRPQNQLATNDYSRQYTGACQERSRRDKLGNIKTLAHIANGLPANNFTRTYNYQGSFTHNRLSNFAIGANTYAYMGACPERSRRDANGNQTKENTDRYFEWNFSDKLVFFKKQAGAGPPGIWTHYLYDAAGQRIKKIVNKTGNIQEITVYIDGIYEYSYRKTSGTLDTTRNYNTLHAMLGSTRVATQRIGNDTDDATPPIKYFVNDHLGNSTVTVQANGSRVNMEEFYPFGETAFGSFAKKRYRYNGKEKDEESGLYEYGQRYYAPWLCRFVSVDPIAEDYPQLSSYNYAGNKPITSPDIEGLQGTEDNKVVTDGAGRDAVIDSGAEIVEADTAVICQEGDKYVYVNGVGFVKESLLQEQNIEPFNPGLDPDNKTGYVYNADDFEMRAKLMKSSLFERTVKQMERNGMTEPLTREGYEDMWGSAGGILFFGNMLQAG